MNNRWKAVLGVAVAAFLAWYWFFSSPYSFVNAGDGKVYKVNKRTGQSWLLVGGREVSTSPTAVGSSMESTALASAKNADTLRQWFPKMFGEYDTNESYIRNSLQNNVAILIDGWEAMKINENTYLVSCQYHYRDKPKRGYFFEVNLSTGTVRNVFADTELAKEYTSFDIHPTYKIVEEIEPNAAEKVKAGKWWADSPVLKIKLAD